MEISSSQINYHVQYLGKYTISYERARIDPYSRINLLKMGIKGTQREFGRFVK